MPELGAGKHVKGVDEYFAKCKTYEGQSQQIKDIVDWLRSPRDNAHAMLSRSSFKYIT